MYYRQKPRKKKNKIKRVTISVIFLFIFSSISLIYYFDKVVQPTVMLVADSEMRARVVEIINRNIINVYERKFNYDDIVNVEKDSNGKVVMLRADTVKLNALATEVAILSQQEIKEVGSIGVKMPLGYISKNNILSYYGPSITVKMEPIGRVETSYDSVFESAGINQTRHKIYINVRTDLKVILPLASREVEVKHEIPVAETVIVGDIPRTALGADLLRNKD